MMKVKIKALFAIVAVTFMLGFALVPFVSDNTENLVADDANADETEGFSISELLGSLFNANQIESNAMSRFFVPVESSGDPTPLGTSVKGSVKVESGVVELSGDYVFETDNEERGSITIGTGATLALFSPEEFNSFSLTNKNTHSEDADSLIMMESGSKISIFNMTFEIIGLELNLVVMNSPEDKANKCSFTFSQGVLGRSEFKVNASEGLEVTIAELVAFEALCDKDVIVVSGNFVPTLTETGFTFSGNVSLYGISPGEVWSDPEDVEFAVDDFLFSYKPNSAGADVKFSMSASADDQINLFRGRVVMNGFALEIEGMSFGIVRGDSDKTLKLELDSSDPVTMRFGDGSSVKLLNAKDASIGLTAKDLVIGFDASNFSSEFTFAEDGWIPNKMDLGGNFSLACVKMDVDVDFKGFSVDFTFSGDVNIDSIHFTYDSDGFGLTVGQATSSGVTSSMEVRYALPKTTIKEYKINKLDIFVKLLYGIESNTDVINVKISSNGGTVTFGFDELKSDLMAAQGSADWNGEFAVSGFSVTTVADVGGRDNAGEALSVEIDKIYAKNDFPMQQVLSSLQYSIDPNVDLGLHPEDTCIPAIDMEFADVAYDGSQNYVSATYLRLDVKDYRGLDEFNIEFKENVTIIFGDDNQEDASVPIVFGALGISGFVKNSGSEKKNFNVTSPSEIAFRIHSVTDLPGDIPLIQKILKFNVDLEIREGNAEFDGGVLPFGIKTNGGTSFKANNLTAAGFVFDKDCAISGTISLDTDADLSLFYYEKSRVIKIGDDYSLAPVTNGYVLSLDLSKKTEGKIVANHGSKLPENFEKDGFSMTSKDQKTGEFNVASSGAVVEMKCIRDKYNLVYEEISESYSYAYGDKVALSTKYPLRPGVEFYGWDDGTMIYRTFDTFVMPSHDVVLRPVFIDTFRGDKVTEDSKTILVVESPEADLVRVNVDDVDWDLLRVTVGDMTFEIDVQTFMKECYIEKYYPLSITIKPIMFQAATVGTDGGRLCCDLRVYVVEEDAETLREITRTFNYSGDTVFNTTVNTEAHGNVGGFHVYETDYKGNVVPIDGVTFTQCGNGTYDVSFPMRHGAQYVIEPFYDNAQSEQGLVMAIVVAVVLICAIGVCYWFKRKNVNSKDLFKGGKRE